MSRLNNKNCNSKNSNAKINNDMVQSSIFNDLENIKKEFEHNSKPNFNFPFLLYNQVNSPKTPSMTPISRFKTHIKQMISNGKQFLNEEEAKFIYQFYLNHGDNNGHLSKDIKYNNFSHRYLQYLNSQTGKNNFSLEQIMQMIEEVNSSFNYMNNLKQNWQNINPNVNLNINIPFSPKNSINNYNIGTINNLSNINGFGNIGSSPNINYTFLKNDNSPFALYYQQLSQLNCQTSPILNPHMENTVTMKSPRRVTSKKQDPSFSDYLKMYSYKNDL